MGWLRPLTKERDMSNATREEREYMADVARLGCAICLKLGYGDTPSEVHHQRKGAGAGRKNPNMQVIPLCPEHHRGNTGIHGMGRKAWAWHYGVSEVDLVLETADRVRALRGLQVR